MNWIRQQSRQENIAYLVMWGLLFATPILSLYVRSMNDADISFEWSELAIIWPKFAIFLALFLIHNFVLAPLLVYEHRRGLYFSLTSAIVVLFAVYQCTTHPRDFRPMHHHHSMMEQRADRPPHPDEGEMPFDMEMEDMEHAPHMEHGHGHKRPPVFVGEHDIVTVIILILMLGMNLGVKQMFKSRKDQQKLARLEKENLEQQLEYLKYQINPHFFMNTLNNIHALVDIDPEKAKSTIVELSKMMRFILYEGDKHGVPLTREFEFIRTYITLMRLRYTDKVKISVDLPVEVPDKTVPPLMLISFIENAFKHGISYQHDSLIDIRVAVEGSKLRFTCRNSKADKPNQEKGGVGLANVKQRLQLLFDNNFTLNIQDEADTYQVELTIPLV